MHSECRVVPNSYPRLRDTDANVDIDSTTAWHRSGVYHHGYAGQSRLAALCRAGLPCLEAAPHYILIAVQGEDPDSIGQAVDQPTSAEVNR